MNSVPFSSPAFASYQQKSFEFVGVEELAVEVRIRREEKRESAMLLLEAVRWDS